MYSVHHNMHVLFVKFCLSGFNFVILGYWVISGWLSIPSLAILYAIHM